MLVIAVGAAVKVMVLDLVGAEVGAAVKVMVLDLVGAEVEVV